MKRIKSAISRAAIRLLAAAGYPWRPNGPDGGRFLVLSATGLGDTLWSTPAIRAIKAAYPEAEIDVVTTRLGRELLLNNPNISNIFTFNRGARGVLPLIKLALHLRSRSYDTAFVFHISDRALVVLLFLAGASRAFGYRSPYPELAAAVDAMVDGHGLHFIDRRLMIASGRGVAPQGRGLDLLLRYDEIDEAGRMFASLGLDGDAPVIGLHPGAQDAFKRWPQSSFIELGQRATRELGCRVVVSGGPSEAALAQSVASSIDGALCLAGRLSVRQLAATIKRLDAFIANDTGPMHMGFAFGTPTIGVFCPTDPTLNGPLEVPTAQAISARPTCDPCLLKKCMEPHCMEQISVGMVMDALSRALASRAHAVGHGVN